MQTVDWTFRLRWILIAIGALFILFRYLPLGQRVRSSFEKRSDQHFSAYLTILCGGFFALALASKWTQLHALALNAQDFWLFEDMLRQMQEGAPFLTRFAPQSVGWVQHGAVHPMFIWYLALPLSWLFGPTFAALAFGPLVLALAGAMLAIISRPHWNAARALLIGAAFLLSAQVGRILNYDVHPEAAYPLFAFLAAWALGWGDGHARPIVVVLATVAGMSIKEDAFLVFFPLLAWTAFRGNRRAALIGSMVALASLAVQFYCIRNWSSGVWGPAIWQGYPVAIPHGPVISGARWDSTGSALSMALALIENRGGVWGTVVSLFNFLISRPWLSILVIAPWVMLQPKFWFLTLGLAGTYALLPVPATLVNYYSAPLLGVFWLCAVTPWKTTSPLRHYFTHYFIWMICAALLLGSGGLEFQIPSAASKETRAEALALIPCLKQLPENSQGLVSPRLLSLVPRESVRTDRVPPSPQHWTELRFALLTPNLQSYELSAKTTRELANQLLQEGWRRWDTQCRPTSSDLPGQVFLLIK